MLASFRRSTSACVMRLLFRAKGLNPTFEFLTPGTSVESGASFIDYLITDGRVRMETDGPRQILLRVDQCKHRVEGSGLADGLRPRLIHSPSAARPMLHIPVRFRDPEETVGLPRLRPIAIATSAHARQA